MRLLLACLIGLLVLPTFALGAQIYVNFDESGKVIAYYGDYYVTNVNGTGYVYNPRNTTLYNVIIPFNLYPMTVIETGETDYIKTDQIVMTELGPFENKSFEYKIIGIPLNDPMDFSRGVFRSGVIKWLRSRFGSEHGRIYSHIMGTLMKSNVENRTTPGSNTRLVSVFLYNPTAFYYNISSVRVIKTTGMDPNRDFSTGWLDEWSFPNEQYPKTVLYPNEKYSIDILDRNASEGEVYWLSSDVYIPDVIINGSNDIGRYTENDVQVYEGEIIETLENGTNVTLLEQPMFIQKKVSKTVVHPGDLVDVDIIITYLGIGTKPALITDAFPYGFTLQSSLENVTGRNMTWYRKIPSKTPLVLKYQLKYEDQNALGLDYFPSAEMFWDNKSLFSQPINFIRRYVPEKVLYIQKSLKHGLNGEVIAKVDLSNMGQSALENVVLKEYLGSSDVFREISQKPYAKGVWQIPSIPAGSIWSVSYVTNEHSSINMLPEVFGISSNYVMKTLIMENVIRSDFKITSTKIIEVVGISFVVALPLLSVFLFKRQKKKKVTEAGKTLATLKELRKKTESDSKHRIHHLLKDTKPMHPVKHNSPKQHPSHKEFEDSHEERLNQIAKNIEHMNKKL